jgi:predicted transcriptional regulator
MATRQIAPVVCPVCGARFTAPIENIIDVGQDPRLKSRFLQGQLNIAQCPQCGTRAPMIAPILYHDPEHELALVFMPNELNLAHTEQQKIIGDLTNTLMNRLKPEQRKAYLLTPKTFFSMESMTKAVLEAEGITPEMLERQRAKAQLINEFLQAQDEENLKKLVKEHDPELDYEFFQILTASAQAAQADGQTQIAQALLGLRSLLAQMSSTGRAAVAEVDASMGLGETITREELLSRLESTQADEDFEELVAAGRPLLDYAFFQNLTSQIETADDPDRAAPLKSLRARILDAVARQDEEARARMQAAANLLKKILEARDPEAAIREHIDQVDDAFFLVLSANIQRAKEENREDVAQALQQVADVIIRLMEDQLPPEVRLINRLLSAPYPDGTRQVLEAQRDMVTPEFVAGLDEVALELEQAGNDELANHMRQVKDQAQIITESVLQTK